MRAAAFTLLVAVPLVVLLGALVVPMVSGTSAELDRTTRNLAEGLRYTRSRALHNNRPETFSLNARTREFQVTDAGGVRRLPEAIEIVFFSTRENRTPRNGGIIRFFSDGSSTGGRLELSAPGGRYLVNVDWLTGKVDVIEAVVDEAGER